MKELLVGTTNPAKLLQIRGALGLGNIEVRGITDKSVLPIVAEDGETACENANKKAIAYAKALNQPVLSMDNALYIDGLSPEKQPGLNVRRIEGAQDRLTDQEMLKYYSNLISGLGGKANGYWEFGVCIATPEGRNWNKVIKSPRVFVARPSEKVVEGYPLESIQIDPVSGRYISEMTQEEQDSFWQNAIGKALLDFVLSVEL